MSIYPLALVYLDVPLKILNKDFCFELKICSQSVLRSINSLLMWTENLFKIKENIFQNKYGSVRIIYSHTYFQINQLECFYFGKE